MFQNESLLQQEKNLELVVNDSIVHIAFGGDVNCGRRQHYASSEHREGFKAALSGVSIMHEVDLNVVNLECVIASVGDYKINKSEQAPYYFRGRPETVNILTSANVGLVSLANNHSFDYGYKAFKQQSKILSDVNIDYVGAGENKLSAFSSRIFHVKGVEITFFAFDTTMKSFSAQEDKAGTAYIDLEGIDALIKEFACKIRDSKRTSDFVIFLCHWEWPPTITPSVAKVNMGRALIDMGADAVIGSSGHKLHGTEIYKGCPIIYDTGNLLFDTLPKGCRNTAIFDLILDKSGIIQILFHPVGSYFGYSKSLSQDEAILASKEYSEKCSILNTRLRILSNGESIIDIRETNNYYLRRKKIDNKYTEYRKTTSSADLESDNLTEIVPDSHQVIPICFNSLQLLGFHCETGLKVNGRQIIWFKTYWKCQSVINHDYRIMIHLINEATGETLWGSSSDHDPCDWQIPTSRWKPHNIYIDRCGLRPLPSSQLSDCTLNPVIYLIHRGNIVHKAEIDLSIEFQKHAVNSLKPLLDCDSERFNHFQESQIKTSIPQDIQVYFMVHKITKERSGLENSVLKRLHMFKRNNMLSGKILVNQYSPHFHNDLAFIRDSFPSIDSSDFFNIFDYYQDCNGFTKEIISHIDLPKKWTSRHVDNTSDLRVYDERNQLRMYIKRDVSSLCIEYINHFHEGCKIRRDTYDSRGFLGRIQHLDKDGRPSLEMYLRPDTTIALMHHVNRESRSVNSVFYIYDKHGVCTKVLDGYNQLQLVWLQSICSKANANIQHVFICDRSESYLGAAVSIKKIFPNTFVVPVFHNTITYNGQDPLKSPIKPYVKNVVANSSNVDCVIVATESQKYDLCNRFSNLAVVNIGHPVCPSSDSKKQRKSLDGKNIVYIARYDSDKNQLDALNVFIKVLEKVPGARMHFYGSGERYRRVLVDMVNQHNLNDKVLIHGFSENVNKIYQDSDVSISTSIREGFSLAVLESLSNGCPVIAYDVKYGPSEMIENNVNGYLVPFGDIVLMAEKVVELLTNNQKGQNMSENSLLDARFSEETIFHKWIALVSALLDRNSKDE